MMRRDGIGKALEAMEQISVQWWELSEESGEIVEIYK